MPRKPDEVLADALELPLDARARIAESLIASLEDRDEVADPAGTHAAWMAEAGRRLAEVNGSVVQPRDAEAVFRVAREELRDISARRRRG
jgi:hypothetical protein